MQVCCAAGIENELTHAGMGGRGDYEVREVNKWGAREGEGAKRGDGPVDLWEQVSAEANM